MTIKHAGNKKTGSHITASMLLFLGSMLGSTYAHSDMITLDFTTYTNLMFNGYSSTLLTTPLVGSYQITLDTASLANTATTNAYNNNPNYTESEGVNNFV